MSRISGGEPVYMKLYKKLRGDIVAGVYAYGSKLPSKRVLADESGVSVITVENAYAMLEEEGYLVSRERSGFFVRELPMLPAGKSLGGAVRYLPEGLRQYHRQRRRHRSGHPPG